MLTFKLTTAAAVTRLIRRPAIAGAALAAAFAVSASAAQASTYCVQDPHCPAGGVGEATVSAALKAADSDVTKDTVRIGAGVFPAPDYTPINPVSITGAGMNATELDDDQGQFTSGVDLLVSGSSVANLTVALTDERQNGVILGTGTSATHVQVTAPHNLSQDNGFSTENGSAVRSVVVDLGDSLSNTAISDGGGNGGATVTDSTLTAGLGILPAGNGTIVRRVIIRATTPLFVFGGTLNIANALLLPHPDDPTSPNFEGAEVRNSNAGDSGLLNAADITIVGGGAGTGLEIVSNPSALGNATANIQGASISGVSHSIFRLGQSITQTADVTIDHSAYAAATVYDGSGNGALTDKGGNLTIGSDPRFVDPAAGDYRLRFDSPLLDRGPTVEPLSDDAPDLGRRRRVRDSDGQGIAVRDIGAYEYQRLAPTARLSVQPVTTVVGSSVAFNATASDPDGDPVSYTWSFGDGTTGSGRHTTHMFGKPGTYHAKVTVIDSTGLKRSATRTVTVAMGPLTLLGLSQSHRRWLTGTKLARISRTGVPVGTTFRFNLNRSARARLAFIQKKTGRNVAGKCLRPTGSNRSKPPCVRTVAVGGLILTAHGGRNRVRFDGRISRTKTLKPGRYIVRVTATDTTGHHSAVHALSFTIAKS